MKTTFYKPVSLLFATALLLSGCTKKFDEINTNPATYSQSSFDPNYLLTTTQLTYTGSTDFSYENMAGQLNLRINNDAGTVHGCGLLGRR